MATGRRVNIGTDETFHLCTVCKGNKRNTEADTFCEDCPEYYCSDCVKQHNDIPSLKNHRIQTLASIKRQYLPRETCIAHGQKRVDMYCEQHDVVGCVRCMEENHSSCKNKHYVPNYVDNNDKAVDLEDASRNFNAVATSLRVFHEAFIKEKERLKCNKEEILKQIRNHRTEINQRLDELEENSIQALEERFQWLTNLIESKLIDLKVSITKLESAQEGLKSAGGNISQMFVSIKMANKVTSTIEDKVDSSDFSFSPAYISFVANEKILELLKEIQALGYTRQTGQVSSRPQSTDSSLQVTRLRTSRPTFDNPSGLPLQVSGKTMSTVKVKSDRKPCVICGACTLEDGTFIIVDSHYGKLKRLNTNTFTVTDYCFVPQRPWQVCAISKQEVAVSCPKRKLIQFVAVGRIMVCTRKIHTGFKCKGLAFSDGKLLVSDKTSVYIYTVSEEGLQAVNKFHTARRLSSLPSCNFSDIRSLAVSRDNTKTYVIDYIKGLIILNRGNHLAGQFNGDELKGATGVCLYKEDGVLVCGKDSENVLQFGPDGKLVGEVLKTEKNCLALCCSTDNSQLIVGLMDSNEIEVCYISGDNE